MPAFDILIPNLLYLAIYSFQPHKEWRFVVYVVPPFLAAASAGAGWIWTRRAKSFVYRSLSLLLVASTLASFIASFGMLFVSRLNYPGAEALDRLHALASNDTGVVKVHMDTLACMTGVTRFMQKPPPVLSDESAAFWVYDKTEDEQRLLDPLFWEGFDYALAEKPEQVIGRWDVLETVEAFAGVGIVKPDEDVDDGLLGSRAGSPERSGGQNGNQVNIKDPDRLLKHIEVLVRKHITQGWWVKFKMEPRIQILKKEKTPRVDEILNPEGTIPLGP